jgi:hypothetical protein
MSIPFPFGLEEDCFGNQRFRLNCTAANETLFSTGGDTQYHVTGLSVEDGTPTVNNASFGKEMIVYHVRIDLNRIGSTVNSDPLTTL